MQKINKKLNANPVGATSSRPCFEGITLKKQKGITLIALIITIIVMLILVGVTINVALNGGLFEKAEKAADLTTTEAEKEALSMAAIAAWEVGTGVNFGAMELPEGFSGSDGTYTSSKSGKTYTVDKATAKVTEGGTDEVDDDLAYLKSEIEGKMFRDVISGLDANGNPIFKDAEIKFVGYVRDLDGNKIAAIGMYKGKYYQTICDDFTLQNPKIIKIEKTTYGVYTDDYFKIGIQGAEAKISGLTQKGKEDIAQNKKLIIPAKIVCENGITYDVIGIDGFSNNTNIEQLEFESGSNLVEISYGAFDGCINLSSTIDIPNSVTKIGPYAFDGCNLIEEIKIPSSVTEIGHEAFRGCTSIENITIPTSVDNLGRGAFDGWTTAQTINMQRIEEPATTDEYRGDSGWYSGWKSGCNANIVWGQ